MAVFLVIEFNLLYNTDSTTGELTMTDDTKEPTRFELFISDTQHSLDEYRKRLSGDGTFDYASQVDALIQLSNQMNYPLLKYLFGEQLGLHLAERFIVECNRNLLEFLSRITSEYNFFILHVLKNNPHLFAYS